MPPPNALIINRFAEDARREYAPGRLCFESNMSARVDRKGPCLPGTFGYDDDLHPCFESRGMWCF